MLLGLRKGKEEQERLGMTDAQYATWVAIEEDCFGIMSLGYTPNECVRFITHSKFDPKQFYDALCAGWDPQAIIKASHEFEEMPRLNLGNPTRGQLELYEHLGQKTK